MLNRNETRLGEVIFNSERRDLRDANGRRIDLRNKSSEVLACLAQRPGEIVGKSEVMACVWPDVTVSDESLTQCIADIRRAIGDKDQSLIKTHVGKGYSLAVSPPAANKRKKLPDKPSIAVLPFTNMSGDPEQEYFSDGITEDIITELARFSSLFVIARNSSFKYKGHYPKIQDVGQELGVHYIVEGSVRRAGNRVRITAQLIEAATGNHAWAERYDREVKDIFAVQDEVVREIATSVPGQLEAVAHNRVQKRPDQDLTAYEFVLRGERMRSQDWGAWDAVPLFEQAIKADPQCARAYAQLASWHGYSIFAHFVPANEARRRTRSLCQKALQIEPSNPIILALLGEAYLMAGDLGLARRCVDKAIKINPNHHYVMAFAAVVLAWLGDADEALRWLERYIRHDPLLWEAATEMEFEVYFSAERYEDAAAAFERWQGPPSYLLAEAAAAFARAGRLEEAQALRAQFENTLPPGYAANDYIAAILSQCAQQKQKDQWLEGFRKAGFEV